MLRVRLDLFVVGAMPSGDLAVFVEVELDCLNDPTAQPIPSGNPQIVVDINAHKARD